MENNAAIGHSQHSFMSQKSMLSNLTSFYDKVTPLADHRKPVNVTDLDFSKAFDNFSHSILLDKMPILELDKHRIISKVRHNTIL